MFSFPMISAVDGLRLFVYHAWPGHTWLGHAWPGAPAAGRREPEGVVVIAHGAGEHAARYARLSAALNDAGWAVLALDQRGHGRSPGPDGHGDFGAGGWDALVADLGQLIDWARARYPRLHLTLLGHSMGAAAAQHFCLTGSGRIDALVLSGSTSMAYRQRQEAAALARGETPVVGLPRPGFEGRTPFDWLSRDPVEVDRYVADPWCGFAFTDAARASMVSRGALTQPALLRNIRAALPVLLLAGDADPVNDGLRGLQALAAEWRAAGVRRIDTQYYPDGRHEMFNEINRDEVTAELIAWLREMRGAYGGVGFG